MTRKHNYFKITELKEKYVNFYKTLKYKLTQKKYTTRYDIKKIRTQYRYTNYYI